VQSLCKSVAVHFIYFIVPLTTDGRKNNSVLRTDNLSRHLGKSLVDNLNARKYHWRSKLNSTAINVYNIRTVRYTKRMKQHRKSSSQANWFKNFSPFDWNVLVMRSNGENGENPLIWIGTDLRKKATLSIGFQLVNTTYRPLNMRTIRCLETLGSLVQ
jgi:hypothetical protein